MYTGIHVKHPLFLSDRNGTWIFSTDFRKILKNQISRKSDQLRQSGSMRTDERTDGRPEMTKLIVAFRNFANGPKRFRVADGNGTYILCPICSFVRLMFLQATLYRHTLNTCVWSTSPRNGKRSDGFSWNLAWMSFHKGYPTDICRTSKCQINMADARKFYAASDAAFLKSPKHTMDNTQSLL